MRGGSPSGVASGCVARRRRRVFGLPPQILTDDLGFFVQLGGIIGDHDLAPLGRQVWQPVPQSAHSLTVPLLPLLAVVQSA